MTDEPNYNPSLARMRNKNGKANAYVRAPKQEKETVARFGGQATPASGARFYKGDARVKGIARIECKSTSADSFRVTKGMFETVSRAGKLNDEVPVMVIEFLNVKGQPEAELSVIRTSDLQELINRVQHAEGTAPKAVASGGRTKLNRSRKTPNG
jgi:hypothetical protein